MKQDRVLRMVVMGLMVVISTLGCKLLSGEVLEEQNPAEIQSEAPVEAPAEVPAGAPFIVDVVTSTDVNPDSYEPVGVTDVFSTAQSVIHCVVITEDAPENTAFKAVWKVVNVEGVESGFVMGEYELVVGGTKNIVFSFAPSAGSLPPGEYQVQIFVNGAPDREVMFSVRP